jgi:hypothetical protein
MVREIVAWTVLGDTALVQPETAPVCAACVTPAEEAWATRVSAPAAGSLCDQRLDGGRGRAQTGVPSATCARVSKRRGERCARHAA